MLLPKPLEPRRVGSGVLDGMLDLAMPEIILNEPRVRALVGKGKAASMPQHVGMGAKGQGSGAAVFLHQRVDGRAMQGLALLADEERVNTGGRLHSVAFFQPCIDGLDLVEAQRVGRR